MDHEYGLDAWCLGESGGPCTRGVFTLHPPPHSHSNTHTYSVSGENESISRQKINVYHTLIGQTGEGCGSQYHKGFWFTEVPQGENRQCKMIVKQHC